jgi:hypothetical protein
MTYLYESHGMPLYFYYEIHWWSKVKAFLDSFAYV